MMLLSMHNTMIAFTITLFVKLSSPSYKIMIHFVHFALLCHLLNGVSTDITISYIYFVILFILNLCRRWCDNICIICDPNVRQ